MTPKYNDSFSSREDIAREFQEDIKTLPSERNILYANYETPPYEGYAYVLFRKGNKLFEVFGSHCSCMGLEGQWKPEETSWAAIAIRNDSTPRAVVEEAKRRVARAR